jgi:hypothetical protein
MNLIRDLLILLIALFGTYLAVLWFRDHFDVPMRGTIRCYDSEGNRIEPTMVRPGHASTTIVFSGRQTG